LKYQLPIKKAQELMTPLEKMKLMFTHFPLLKAIGKWKKVSIKDFTNRFKDPFLKEAFIQIKGLFSDDLPIMIIQMFLAWSHLRSAGYPEGGALVLPKAIEDKFLKLGGEIKYGSKVTQILVEDGNATGVQLEDGSEYRSDHVISAADGRTTIYEMLGGKYFDSKVRSYYEKFPLAPQVMIVALGLSRGFEDIPHLGIGLIFELEQPVTIGEKELKSLRPMIYNFDPALAPEGKTLMRIVLPTEYDYWMNLKQADGKYKEEKQRIAEQVISLLEQRFPGISSDVEMVDVATPLTFEKFTGNWRGSIIGWDATTETAFKPIPKTLPGLQNFWMAGQWVEPGGGVPMVALSGRYVIQLIAKKDRKSFTT
jgi:phytoene dehydrogenase-like protein